MVMVEDNFYTDAPALVLRSTNDFHDRNLLVIDQLVKLVEEKNGKVKFPLLITGFDVKAKSDDGYGIKIVPRDDFQAVFDERLSGKYDCKRFSGVDELGLPKFEYNGKRKWHAKGMGVSGFYLGSYLGLYSMDEDLALSSGEGRIVLVRDGNLEGMLR